MVTLDRRLSRLDLSFSQYLVLVRLWRSHPEPLTQTTLRTDLALERSSISTLLAGMERSGLVARAEDPLDARRLIVSLTSAGRDRELPVRQVIDAYEHELLGDLEKQEQAALQALLVSLWDRARHLRSAEDAEAGAEAGHAEGIAAATNYS